MRNGKATVIEGGFSIQPSQDHLDRQARDQRMKERMTNPKANPTNRDIQEQLNDLSALLLESRIK